MPNPAWRLNRAELARLNRQVIIDPDTQCWVWQGKQNSNGYGMWQRGPGFSPRVTHRIVWEHYMDQEIPEGMQLDHLCRNRLCCNPEHFEVVTPSVNTLRQNHFARNKTHCPKGHPYDEKNTRITPQGKRACRQCDRDRKGSKTPYPTWR